MSLVQFSEVKSNFYRICRPAKKCASRSTYPREINLNKFTYFIKACLHQYHVVPL